MPRFLSAVVWLLFNIAKRFERQVEEKRIKCCFSVALEEVLKLACAEQQQGGSPALRPLRQS